MPATCGIISGVPHVGLSDAQLLNFASSKRDDVVKTSRRDFSYVMSQKLNGATTVSGTMLLAHMAGIKVFVTGGLGGVHRDGEKTFDISADLTELGRTPVAVVSAGVKSILDIGRTLEYLETQGVPVTTIGSSTDFPGFYTRKSGFHSPQHVTDAKSAASLLTSHMNIGISNGLVFAVPLPEEEALEFDQVNSWIQDALQQARDQGVTGKLVTPFLLSYLNTKTEGKTLNANLALIRNNTRVGADIAIEFCRLQSSKHQATKSSSEVLVSSTLSPPCETGPLFFGVAAIDYLCHLKPTKNSLNEKHKWSSLLETSSPAELFESFGGVARNAFEACSRVISRDTRIMSQAGSKLSDLPSEDMPCLVAPIGQDSTGITLKNIHETMGFLLRPINVQRTPSYHAIYDENGDLIIAGADMDSSRDVNVSRYMVDHARKTLPSYVCMDANIDPKAAKDIIAQCQHAPVFLEPTSVPKMIDFVMQGVLEKGISFISPNEKELLVLDGLLPDIVLPQLSLDYSVINSDGVQTRASPSIKGWEKLEKPLRHLLEYVPNVLLKIGPEGVIFAQKLASSQDLRKTINEECGVTSGSSSQDVYDTTKMVFSDSDCWNWNSGIAVRHYTPSDKVSVQSANGAGDTLVGAFVGLASLSVKDVSRTKPEFTNPHVKEWISDINIICPQLWQEISPKSRTLALLSLDGIHGREKIIDFIMLKARRCAELSLESDSAVSNLVGNAV